MRSALLAVLALLGCARSSPEARFWSWFRSNSEALAKVVHGDEAIGDDLHDRLGEVKPGLTWELEPKPDRGARTFVVSADGNRELFGAVQRLVAAAPAMPEWRVVAFRQRRSLDLPVVYQGTTLRADDVWLRASPDGDKLALTLYTRGLTDRNHDALAGTSLLLLDGAVGEYDVETKIGGLEWRPLPDDPKRLGLKALRDLPALVDAFPKR